MIRTLNRDFAPSISKKEHLETIGMMIENLISHIHAAGMTSYPDDRIESGGEFTSAGHHLNFLKEHIPNPVLWAACERWEIDHDRYVRLHEAVWRKAVERGELRFNIPYRDDPPTNNLEPHLSKDFARSLFAAAECWDSGNEVHINCGTLMSQNPPLEYLIIKPDRSPAAMQVLLAQNGSSLQQDYRELLSEFLLDSDLAVMLSLLRLIRIHEYKIRMLLRSNLNRREYARHKCELCGLSSVPIRVLTDPAEFRPA